MALIKNRNPNIHIWKNTESSNELFSLLNNKAIHKERILAFKSDERVKQYLTNRLLVQNIIGNFSILKGVNHKPYLEDNSLAISFSHNKNFTILMISEVSCGVDIQTPTEKAVKVKRKFINEKDYCVNSNNLETLSMAWSCKEAAFKKFGNQEIFLKENISITKALPNNTFEVLVQFDNEQHTILLKKETIENDYLFFTIN